MQEAEESRRIELEPLPGAHSVALLLDDDVRLAIEGLPLRIEEVQALAEVAPVAREHGVDARKWLENGCAVGARRAGAGTVRLYGEINGQTVTIAEIWEDEVDEAAKLLRDAVDAARAAEHWVRELMRARPQIPLPSLPPLPQ